MTAKKFDGDKNKTKHNNYQETKANTKLYWSEDQVDLKTKEPYPLNE